MIDITGIRIRELFIHRIGNQLRNEGVSLSESAQQLSPRDELPLIQFLFGNADNLNSYTFTHSVDTELNTLSVLAETIASKPNMLKRTSADIAAHLYSVSNHPRVKAGNLFVGLFDGIRFEGKICNFLGIFKSDTVNDFIKVDVKGGKASLKIEQGAAITSLDKAGLVILPQRGKPKQVLAACARGEDAVFWNEGFFQLVPAHSPKVDTKACLDTCRDFANRGDGNSDDETDFASVFTSKNQEKEFYQFKNERKTEDQRNIPEYFEIEKTVVRKERTKFQKNVKLDLNIEIRLRFKNQNEMKKRVEQGFDHEKGLAFYKLYYSTKK